MNKFFVINGIFLFSSPSHSEYVSSTIAFPVENSHHDKKQIRKYLQIC
jgi:hypothetical protein